MGIRVWRDPRLERIEGEGAGGRWTKIKGQAWRQGGWLHPVLTSSLTGRLSGRAPHLAGNGPERPLAGAELTPEGQAGRAELHMPSALFCSVVLNPGRA